MMQSTPLSDINVVMLCEYTHNNRQTFYYHYRDIADVIENIFLKERVGVGKRLNDFESINRAMINYINSSYHFLSEVAKSYASDKLNEFIFSFYYRQLINIATKSQKNEELYSTITRYMATIMAKELTFWISTKRKEKSTDLTRRVTVIWNYLNSRYVLDLKKARI